MHRVAGRSGGNTQSGRTTRRNHWPHGSSNRGCCGPSAARMPSSPGAAVDSIRAPKTSGLTPSRCLIHISVPHRTSAIHKVDTRDKRGLRAPTRTLGTRACRKHLITSWWRRRESSPLRRFGGELYPLPFRRGRNYPCEWQLPRLHGPSCRPLRARPFP